jgi:hypothetical protein
MQKNAPDCDILSLGSFGESKAVLRRGVWLIHKELNLPGTLHRTLQLLSVHPFEKMPVHELLTESDSKTLEPLNHNQLLL